MNRYFVFSLATLFTSFQLFAAIPSTTQGDGVGNGGGAWACFKNNKIEKIEIVDIFEGENVHLYKYNKKLTYEKYMAKAFSYFKALSPTITEYLGTLLTVYQKTRRSPIGKLGRTKDHNFLLFPHDNWCSKESPEFIQIVNFLDNGIVLIDHQAYYSLSPFQKAALDLHEVIYKLRREMYGDSSSVVTRKIVALLLSELNHEETLKELQPYFVQETLAQVLSMVPGLPPYQAFATILSHMQFSTIPSYERLENTKWSCFNINTLLDVDSDQYISTFKKIDNLNNIVFDFSIKDERLLNHSSVRIFGSHYGFGRIKRYNSRYTNFPKKELVFSETDDQGSFLVHSVKNLILRMYRDKLVFEVTTRFKSLPYPSSIAFPLRKVIANGYCEKRNEI